MHCYSYQIIYSVDQFVPPMIFLSCSSHVQQQYQIQLRIFFSLFLLNQDGVESITFFQI